MVASIIEVVNPLSSLRRGNAPVCKGINSGKR